MITKTNQKQYILRGCLISICLLCLCITPGLAGVSDTTDSPEVVFQVAQIADARKDFGILARLVAPTEHTLLARGTDMAVGLTVMFYEGEKAPEFINKYKEIHEKYNIKTVNENPGLEISDDTPQPVIDAHIRKRAEKLYGQVDIVNYVPDLMEIVLSLPELADASFIPHEKLTDVKIEGDRATGRAGDKTISFIRKNSQWYLTADIME